LDGKKVITVPNAPKLPFSPAIKAGDYIFVSGQVGFSGWMHGHSRQESKRDKVSNLSYALRI